MVDWIIEVTQVYKTDERVFFLAVALMDNFLASSSQSLQTSDVHGLGLTCMFMASKFEDIHPLDMRSLHSRIGHKQIPINMILQREREIFTTLNFNVSFTLSYDIVLFLTENLIAQDEIEVEMIKGIREKSLFWLKLSLHFHEFLNIDSVLMATACVYTALLNETKRSLPTTGKTLKSVRDFSITLFVKTILRVSSMEINDVHELAFKLSEREKTINCTSNLKKYFL